MNLLSFAIFALLMGAMFFMQKKQAKQAQDRYEQLKKLSKGDQVVTLGGLYATVDAVDGDKGIIVLDADGIFLTYELSAIKRVVSANLADGTTAGQAVEGLAKD